MSQNSVFSLKRGYATALPALAGLAALLSFVSDMAKPLGPYTEFVFIGGCSATFLFAILFLIPILRPRIASTFVFFVIFTLFSGATWFFQENSNSDARTRGFAAANVTSLANAQVMLGFFEDVTLIRQSSARTADALEAIAINFQNLTRLGGIIDNPASISDFYNNALVYQHRGDSLGARKAFEKAVALNIQAVDVHERYVAVLKAHEGVIGGRKIYADIIRSQPQNLAAKLTYISLLPSGNRESKLKEIEINNPGFAPVQYALASLYSIDRLGHQSRSDKTQERKWLEAFISSDSDGKVQRWFLDKTVADNWRATVKRRYAFYKDEIVVSPVNFSTMAHNTGWTVTAQPSEVARSISYRLQGEAIFQDTGYMNYIDSRTNTWMPKAIINLSRGTLAQTIEVKYVDMNNETQGPFLFDFDPEFEFIINAKRLLESTKTSWAGGRDFDGKYLVYFSHLLSYRCGLQKIEYSFKGNIPDMEWPFDECDPLNPHNMPVDSEIYTEIDNPVSNVKIQLTYKDGTQSQVETIQLFY